MARKSIELQQQRADQGEQSTGGNPAAMGWRELLHYAKQQGVNTYRKSREAIEADLAALA